MQNLNIHAFLAKLKNVKQSSDTSWTAYCPVHEGGGGVHNNSLSISAGNDGRILVNCHNGCNAKEVVYSTGMTWKDMMPEKKSESTQKITATYDYVNEDGVLVFQVVRLEPGKGGAKKEFRQRRPDGKGGWSWKTKGITKFPYRIQEVIAKKGPIVIVEGEKQVDYLRSLGLNATCNPGGAGKWLVSYAKYFRGRDVIIVPDADLPNKVGLIVGADHAKKVADSLLGEAESVHVVELPLAQPKWGLDDWLLDGRTLADFQEVLNTCDPWGPDSEIITRVDVKSAEETMDPLINYRRILDEIGITYVAEHDVTRVIEIFSVGTQKFTQLRDPSKLQYEVLVAACGLPVIHKVRRTSEDTGEFSLSEVRTAIAIIGGQTRASDERRGVGIWNNNGAIVVVNARKMGVLNGSGELQLTQNPVYLGVPYNIGDRCDWIDLDHVSLRIKDAGGRSGETCLESIDRVREMFDLWSYTAPNHVNPEILTGMVMASLVQTMWDWRPQIFLIGQSYAGKTTMMHVVASLFGEICEMASNSSAAGLRQLVGESGRIAMCDELEKSRHKKDILEMIRAAGRGDKTVRGSASQSAHKEFRLQHIFWCSAIESGLSCEADQSRFIVIELKRTDKKLQLPSLSERASLGEDLACAAIVNFWEAKRLVDVLLMKRPQDVHGRVAESYAVPCAMYAAATGMEEDDAVELFVAALRSVSEGDEVESDIDTLMHDIFMSAIRTPGGQAETVISLIERRQFGDNEEILSAAGIHVEAGRVFIHCRQVERYVLTHTAWIGKRTDQILARVPNAKRERKRFGRGQFRYISIPLDEIKFSTEEQIADIDPFG